MDYKTECEKISKWLQDFIFRTKTKGFVVGLSGGIDSAVVSSLCVQAVGPENVIGVSMPCYSSDSSISDAELLANNLRIKMMSFNLEKAFESIREPLKRCESSEDRKLSDGNIKARLRMIKLYEVANLNNLLVAGTSNKTEMMIGYFTKYGDGGCDLEPIADYYKYEVYELAKNLPAIPITTIIKSPSADLWNGQTDEQEIGFTYIELDKMLEMIEKFEEIPNSFDQFFNYLMNYIITRDLCNEKMGECSKWKKLYKMINGSSHKRNMPPSYIREVI